MKSLFSMLVLVFAMIINSVNVYAYILVDFSDTKMNEQLRENNPTAELTRMEIFTREETDLLDSGVAVEDLEVTKYLHGDDAEEYLKQKEIEMEQLQEQAEETKTINNIINFKGLHLMPQLVKVILFIF